MVFASDLQSGMALEIEGQIYKVLEVEARAGAAKLGGVVKTKLINVRSGRMWEPHFRLQERLQDLELERRPMQFLYAESDLCTFMDPDSFEQIAVPSAILGNFQSYLQPGTMLPIEFSKGEPISATIPDVVEIKVTRTATPIHAQQDSAWKQAVLENGASVRVPLFIAEGETIRVEVQTGRYVERVRSDRKRSA
jgi:elongation factor P